MAGQISCPSQGAKISLRQAYALIGPLKDPNQERPAVYSEADLGWISGEHLGFNAPHANNLR
jgi:hypothetical protein